MFHTVAQKRDHISAVHGIKIAGHKYVEPVVSTEEDESSAAEQYACPECDKHYANPDSMRKHAKSAHDKVLAYCRHCRLAFKTDKAKDRHVTKVHDGGRTVDNSVAAVVSPPKDNSRKRKLSDEPPPAPQASSAESQEEGVFACPKCPRLYSLQASLRKHCFRQHNHLAIKICRTCPRVFTKRKPFESHSKKCSDTPKTVASELLPPPPPSPPAVTTVKPVRIPFTKQASIKSFITPLANVKH